MAKGAAKGAAKQSGGGRKAGPAAGANTTKKDAGVVKKVAKASDKKTDTISTNFVLEATDAQWKEDVSKIVDLLNKDRNFTLVTLGFYRRHMKKIETETRFHRNQTKQSDVPFKVISPILLQWLKSCKIPSLTLKALNKDKAVQRQVFYYVTQTSGLTEISIKEMLIDNYQTLMLGKFCNSRAQELVDMMMEKRTVIDQIQDCSIFKFDDSCEMVDYVIHCGSNTRVKLPVSPFHKSEIGSVWRISSNGVARAATVNGPNKLAFPLHPLFPDDLLEQPELSICSSYMDVERSLKGDYHDGDIQAARLENRIRDRSLQYVNAVHPLASSAMPLADTPRDADTMICEVDDDTDDDSDDDVRVAPETPTEQLLAPLAGRDEGRDEALLAVPTGEAEETPKMPTGEAEETPKMPTGEAEETPKMPTGEAEETPKMPTGEAEETPKKKIKIKSGVAIVTPEKPEKAIVNESPSCKKKEMVSAILAEHHASAEFVVEP